MATPASGFVDVEGEVTAFTQRANHQNSPFTHISAALARLDQG
jgi:hypothetical protein